MMIPQDLSALQNNTTFRFSLLVCCTAMLFRYKGTLVTSQKNLLMSLVHFFFCRFHFLLLSLVFMHMRS